MRCALAFVGPWLLCQRAIVDDAGKQPESKQREDEPRQNPDPPLRYVCEQLGRVCPTTGILPRRHLLQLGDEVRHGCVRSEVQKRGVAPQRRNEGQRLSQQPLLFCPFQEIERLHWEAGQPGDLLQRQLAAFSGLLQYLAQRFPPPVYSRVTRAAL